MFHPAYRSAAQTPVSIPQHRNLAFGNTFLGLIEHNAHTARVFSKASQILSSMKTSSMLTGTRYTEFVPSYV